MRILVATQSVDADDPVLGFFHRWLEAFSAEFDSVEVICLNEGRHALPANVRIHTLGKKEGGNRLLFAARFLRLSWELRRSYDAVFVHMNPEYVVLAGWLWRLLGMKIGLWYTHKSVDLKLRAAESVADIVFTASKESFRLRSKKLRVMGHGIDTAFWTPDETVFRGPAFLSVGRLMAAKRHDLAIRAAKEEGVPLRIAGVGPEQEELEALARELAADVSFLGAQSEEKLRDEYRRAARLVHRSETGSLDKVVLEAAACGCPVDSTDPAIRALPLSASFVREHHSLQSLVPRIRAEYER